MPSTYRRPAVLPALALALSLSFIGSTFNPLTAVVVEASASTGSDSHSDSHLLHSDSHSHHSDSHLLEHHSDESHLHSDSDSHLHLDSDSHLHHSDDSDHLHGSELPVSDSHADHDHAGHEEDEHEDAHAEEEKAGRMKGMSLAVIGGLGIIVDVVVIMVPGLHTNNFIMSLFNSFAGGIFIVVGLAHILAEGIDIIGVHSDAEQVERYRPGYMVAIAGYFAMVFLQRGVFKVATSHTIEKNVKQLQDEDESNKATANEPTKEMDENPTSSDEDAKSSSGAEPLMEVVSSEDDQKENAAGDDEHEEAVHHHHHHRHHHRHHEKVEEEEDPVAAATRKQAALQQHRINMAVQFIVFFVHGLTAGLALGLQTTSEGVILVFIAIIAHHWAHDMIFAFTTGKAMLPRVLRIVLTSVASLNTSIGIAIGWGLSTSVPPLANGYISAFCGGTFLMIAMTDIVGEEMPLGRRNIPQLVCFVLGIGVMYGLLAGFYSKEAHAH